MSKINISVEMDEKEYDEYRKFLNGEHVSQESIKDMLLSDFLRIKGFELVSGESSFDGVNNETVIETMYKKDRFTVAVKFTEPR